MKKINNIKTFAVAAFGIILSFTLLISYFNFTPEKAYAYNAETQKLTDQKNQLAKKQKELEAKIASSTAEAGKAIENKNNLDALLSTLQQKSQIASQLAGELQTKIEAITAEIEYQEKQKEVTFEKFQQRMRISHEESTVTVLSLLLNASSLKDFLSRLEKVNTMLDYDNNLIENYEKQKTELQNNKTELDSSLQIQKETLETLETDKQQIEKLAAEAADYYLNIKADAEKYKNDIAAIKEKEQQLDDDITALLQKQEEETTVPETAPPKVETTAPPTTAKPSDTTAAEPPETTAPVSPPTDGDDGDTVVTDYIWPLPSAGRITCRFGETDPAGKAHYALDVAIAHGTKIYAVAAGKVLRAEFHSSYGYYVLIDHGNGKATLYAHCSSLNVAAGQKVTQGKVIGYVGTTGFSTGNHLHFEFRVNGIKVNPLTYVTQP